MSSLSPKNPALTRSLKTLLSEECQLYERYLAILKVEKELLRQLKKSEHTEELMALTKQREIIYEEMQIYQIRRVELIKDLPLVRAKKFSEIVLLNFHPSDQKELMPLLERLKGLMLASQRAGIDFKQVINFSLNMVNGLVSIFLSATQSVVRSYTRRGALKERACIDTGSSQRVLKEV